MIVGHLADLHITERRGDGGESLDEQVERLVWCGEDAHAAGAELLVVAGDVFDRTSTPAERNAAIDVFTNWAAAIPVVVVYGNHDRPGDLDFLGRLRTAHEIQVFDRPGFYTTAACVVSCIPWPRKAHLAALGLDGSLQMETTASQAIRAILLSSAQRFAKWSKPGVLLAHLEVGAALTDSGQPLVGKADIELAEGDLLDSGADYIALGHIHKHQVLCDRVCYAGASRQCTFGEDPVKGYCLTAVERGEPPKIEHRRAPGRDLVTVEGAWDGEAVSFDTRPSEVPMNAIVRVRFETPEDAMQAASQSVDSYVRALDGQTVRIVPKVIPTSRVRSAEIHKARTNAERVEALWKVRDQRPERAGQILTKLGQLDSEVPA